MFKNLIESIIKEWNKYKYPMQLESITEEERTKLNKNGFWVTRDLVVYPIETMDLDHLYNVRTFLVRKARADHQRELNFYLTCDEPDADGALMAFEMEFSNVISRDWVDYLPEIFYKIESEIAKRELQIFGFDR